MHIVMDVSRLSRMLTEAFWKYTDDRGSATDEVLRKDDPAKCTEEERPVITYSQGNCTSLWTVVQISRSLKMTN